VLGEIVAGDVSLDESELPVSGLLTVVGGTELSVEAPGIVTGIFIPQL